MKALLKVATILIVIAVGVYLVVTVFRTDWRVQLASVSFAVILNVWSMGWSSTILFLATILPAAMLIGVISLALILLGGSDAQILWQVSSFVYSMLWVRGVLAHITYADIITLPVSARWRKDMLTFRAIMASGQPVLRRLLWYADRLSGPNNTRIEIYSARLSSVLGAVVWLFAQAELISLLVENRLNTFGGDGNES